MLGSILCYLQTRIIKWNADIVSNKFQYIFLESILYAFKITMPDKRMAHDFVPTVSDFS